MRLSISICKVVCEIFRAQRNTCHLCCAEHYKHMRSFHALLPKILKPDGIYSFFNGLAPRSAFFQKVYRHIVADELAEEGFASQYMELPVNVESSGWDKAWTTVKTRYFFSDSYYLPIVYWKD